MIRFRKNIVFYFFASSLTIIKLELELESELELKSKTFDILIKYHMYFMAVVLIKFLFDK